MAGGFTLKKNNISLFRTFLNEGFEKSTAYKTENMNYYLDSLIAPSAININFFDEINNLAPFGSGNNEPKFAIENIKVISSNIIANNHIRAVLIGRDGYVFNGFMWNGKDSCYEPFLTKGNKKPFNIAGKMRLNEWRGEKKIEFYIEDITAN